MILWVTKRIYEDVYDGDYDTRWEYIGTEYMKILDVPEGVSSQSIEKLLNAYDSQMDADWRFAEVVEWAMYNDDWNGDKDSDFTLGECVVQISYADVVNVMMNGVKNGS